MWGAAPARPVPACAGRAADAVVLPGGERAAMRISSTLSVFACYLLGFFWCRMHPELYKDVPQALDGSSL